MVSTWKDCSITTVVVVVSNIDDSSLKAELIIHQEVKRTQFCSYFSVIPQQTMANRFASESDPLNLLSCSNFQPKTSSVYVMKVYPSSDT